MALVRLEDSNWKLPDSDFDLRGRSLHDAAGHTIGEIRSMMVDSDRQEVVTVVLDNGRELPVRDIEIRSDGVFYLPPAAADYDAPPLARTQAPPAPAPVASPPPVSAPPAASAAVTEYHDFLDDFQRHYGHTYRNSGRDYAAYEPAYRFGYDTAYDSRFAGRGFEEAEPELRQAYYQRHGYPMSDPHIWADVKDAVRHAFGRVRGW